MIHRLRMAALLAVAALVGCNAASPAKEPVTPTADTRLSDAAARRARDAAQDAMKAIKRELDASGSADDRIAQLPRWSARMARSESNATRDPAARKQAAVAHLHRMRDLQTQVGDAPSVSGAARAELAYFVAEAEADTIVADDPTKPIPSDLADQMRIESGRALALRAELEHSTSGVLTELNRFPPLGLDERVEWSRRAAIAASFGTTGRSSAEILLPHLDRLRSWERAAAAREQGGVAAATSCKALHLATLQTEIESRMGKQVARDSADGRALVEFGRELGDTATYLVDAWWVAEPHGSTASPAECRNRMELLRWWSLARAPIEGDHGVAHAVRMQRLSDWAKARRTAGAGSAADEAVAAYFLAEAQRIALAP